MFADSKGLYSFCLVLILCRRVWTDEFKLENISQFLTHAKSLYIICIAFTKQTEKPQEEMHPLDLRL